MSYQNKVAVFICKCGPNIYDKLNFDELKNRLKQIYNVYDVYDENFYCSLDGKKKIIDIIKENNIKRCCFAACSHRVHEKTFMSIAEDAGINPYLIQIANIREHITWVTSDKDKATEKAYDQIKSAINRTMLQKELSVKSMEALLDIAIIGGGIAGIKAAKTLARDKNRTIYIIEKDVSLGGWMPKWEKSYPDMDCNPCFLAPELSDIKDIKNIRVITSAEINDIKGFYGNFTINITEKPRYINDNCIGCMECFEVCPVSVKNSFNANMDYRKAVYLPFMGNYPPIASIDSKNCLNFHENICNKCKEVCDALFGAVDFSQKPVNHQISVGGIIISTGFDFIDINEYPKYNWTGKNNVFTNFEFERMMSSTGPTLSKIKTRSLKDPKNVGIILCGGRKKYCSAVCCGATEKYIEFLLEHNKKVKISCYHSELCINDEGLQKLHNKLLSHSDVSFVKIDDYSNISINIVDNNNSLSQENNNKSCDEEDKNCEVVFYQNNKLQSVEHDMIIVSMGIENSVSSLSIRKMLDLTVNEEGWFSKYHNKMEPVTSNVEGVYLAGCCINPYDVQKTVISAKASAGEALTKLLKGVKIELESIVSYVNEEKCGGCKICKNVCPFKAIDYNETKKVSSVNQVLCKGCGTCVASCPSGAMKNYHFEKEQIEAEIDSF